MSGLQIFVLSSALYALIPVAILATGSFRYVLLYTHIAGMLVIGGFVGVAYSLRITDGIEMGSGQVLYGALMFTTLVAVLVGRDLRAVRTVISLVVSVNLLVSAVLFVSQRALRSEATIRSGLIAPEVIDQSWRVIATGGVLIILELVLLLALLEFAKVRLRAAMMAPVYVVGFVAVLILDGVLFPLLLLGPGSISAALLVEGLQTKLVLAAAFSIPLAGFVSAYRPTIAAYESTPLNLRDLVFSAPSEIVHRLARQEEELTQAADREERATATVTQVLDSATDTILMALDTDGRITHFSAGAERLLGWARSEVLGRGPDRLHESDFWTAQGALLGVAPTVPAVMTAHADEPASREMVLITREGEPLPVSLSTTRILGARGQLIGFVATGEEISARLRLRAATLNALSRDQESLQRLQEVNDFKDSLISTVSHELRTPLASIAGYVELLEHGDLGDLSGQQHAAIETVSRNSRRLISLVDSLLTLSRVETDLARSSLVAIDLRGLLDGLRPAISDLAIATAPEVTVTVRTSADPLPVLGDPGSLESLVINLVTNALKFTVGPGSVEVVASQEGDDIVLVVSDTGIGIAPDERERLFTTFFRSAEATRRAIPGTGLGLSIVAAIVEQHAGSITVDSEPGRGTRMSVSLPAVTPPDPARGTD